MTRLFTVLLVALFAFPAFAAPVPKSLKKKPLRAKIEPRPGEKLFTADFKDEPFPKVADWLERETEMMFISKDKPDLKITLRAEKVCQAELFAQLNDILYPQGWVVSRKTLSFSTLKVKDLARMDPQLGPLILAGELEKYSPYEPVRLLLVVKDGGVDTGLTLAEEIKGDGFQVKDGGPNRLIVHGLTMDVTKFKDEMGGYVEK